MMGPPMLDVAFAGGAVRASESEFKRIMGIPDEGLGIPKSLLDFARQPADEAWVYRCVSLKAMAATKPKLRVEVKDDDHWVPLDGMSDSAAEDLQWLLDDVNPAWEGAQLQAYLSASGSVHGGSGILVVRGRYGGQPQELHWLSAAHLEPEMGRTWPKGYWYSPQGTFAERVFYPTVWAEPTARKYIIPIRDTVNLADPWQWLSPLSSARFDISANRQASEWNDALLRNWGIPAGAWSADPAAEIGPQDKSFIKRALAALRGPRNQGKSPVLPGGLKWQQLSLTQKDADWIGTRKVSRMTICAVLGVPLVLAGDDEKASVYASMRDAERVFWRQSMINELDHRAVPINAHLVPAFDPTRKKMRVCYDYTVIEALRGAPTEEMQVWLEYVKEGLPINRAIKQFGMGAPLDEGDEEFKHQKDAEKRAQIDAERKEAAAEAMAGAMPKVKPEEFKTAGKMGTEPKPSPGGDRVRSIGGKLYKHPAVVAFLDSGDKTKLTELVDEDEVGVLATGLRRRYSVRQILEGDVTRDYPGLRVPPPADDRIDILTQRLEHVAELAARPRKVIKVPYRDASGRIIRVEEIIR